MSPCLEAVPTGGGDALTLFPQRFKHQNPLKDLGASSVQNATPAPLNPVSFALHVPTQTVSYIGTSFVESSGRKEGTLTRGWATRILRQSVEGTAVVKVSVGTSPACHSPEPGREAPLFPCPSFRHKPGIPHLECCWDAARPWQQLCFSALAPHSAADRIPRVSMDISAGFHSVSSALAVLIPPASI